MNPCEALSHECFLKALQKAYFAGGDKHSIFTGFFLGCRMYEFFMNKKAQCEALARQTTDKNLKIFYSNAAYGFMCKAYNLSVSEA